MDGSVHSAALAPLQCSYGSYSLLNSEVWLVYWTLGLRHGTLGAGEIGGGGRDAVTDMILSDESLVYNVALDKV